ncbi:MAG TPA: MraY family glycosyltransferase [Terriglobales bacterium]|nr:MraY family glycosyltransferase [Terriglobales bacterium]
MDCRHHHAFNLLDNMDGLCAGTAVIAGLYLAILYLADGARGCVILICAAAESIAGFLLFNFHPARIFIGDSGSRFIGFLLATSSLVQTTRASGMPASVFTPVILLAVPILDTLLVAVSRRLRAQPISRGGTDHTSHRLVRLGMTEGFAVLLLYTITVFSGTLALAARHLASSRALVVMTLWLALLLLLGAQLFKMRSGVRVESRAQAV